MALVLCVGCASPSIESKDNSPVDTTIVPDPGSIAPLTELCVNEFVADGEGAWLDDQGNATDWIELHNPTDTDLSLAGFFLTDNADNPYKSALDATLTLEAGGFLVFSADNQPELGPTHLSFALDQAGETVGLFRFDGAGQLIHFGAVDREIAWARQPDCCVDVASCAVDVVGGTPGISNVQVLGDTGD